MELGPDILIHTYVYLNGIGSLIHICHLNLLILLLLCQVIFAHVLDYRDQIINILLNIVEFLAHHRLLFLSVINDRILSYINV